LKQNKTQLRVSLPRCGALYEEEQEGFPQEYFFDVLKFIVYKTSPTLDPTGTLQCAWASFGPSPSFDYTSESYVQFTFQKLILRAFRKFTGWCSEHYGPKRPTFDLFTVDHDGDSMQIKEYGWMIDEIQREITRKFRQKRDILEGEYDPNIQQTKPAFKRTRQTNDDGT
jgi:hypothetical protein